MDKDAIAPMNCTEEIKMQFEQINDLFIIAIVVVSSSTINNHCSNKKRETN